MDNCGWITGAILSKNQTRLSTELHAPKDLSVGVLVTTERNLEGQTAKTDDCFVDSPERNEVTRDTENKDVRIQHLRLIYTREPPIPPRGVRADHAADELATMRTEDRSNHGPFLVRLGLIASFQRFGQFGFNEREVFLQRRIEQRQSDAKAQYQDQQAEMKQVHTDSPLTNFERMLAYRNRCGKSNPSIISIDSRGGAICLCGARSLQPCCWDCLC